MFLNNIKIFYKWYIQLIYFLDCTLVFWTIYTLVNVEITILHASYWLATNLFNANTLSRISFGIYCEMSLVPMCKIRNSGCPFETGFKWSYMSVIFAHGNCLTFVYCFWESKLPSIRFNLESPTMQMVRSGNLFGVSLAGRLSSCVTGVT